MSHKKSNIPIVASLEGHVGRILSVAFHLTAPLLATGSEDGNVKLWDTDSQQCVGTLVGHTNIVRSVAFHPTAPVLISGSTDKTLKVWDTTTQQCLSTTQAHEYGVSCVAFHPSEPLIVTGGVIDFPKLWKLSPGGSGVTLVNDDWSRSHRHPSVNSVAFHPSAPLIATSGSNGAMLWLLLPNNQVNWLGDMDDEGAGLHRDVLSVAFHPTAPILVTGGKDKNVKLWQIIFDPRSADRSVGSPLSAVSLMRHYNVKRIECVATLEGHEGIVTSVAFHPTAPVILSGSTDKTIKLWRLLPDEMSMVCMATLAGQGGSVASVAFHPNGRLIASGNSENTATLWDCSVLSTTGQRKMALMRGVEKTLLPRLFSGRTHMPLMPYAERYIVNKVGQQRGPNFFLQEESARKATARARATSSRRVMALIEGPRLRPKSPSPESPSSKEPSPKSPSSKTHKSGGGYSRTHRRKKHSSRKVKRRVSKTKRYRRFR